MGSRFEESTVRDLSRDGERLGCLEDGSSLLPSFFFLPFPLSSLTHDFSLLSARVLLSLEVIKRLGYEEPSSIQAQAIPAIMSGRDVIGVAKTGSGKTIAFLLPLLRHINDQPALEPGDGPMAVIMTPTRELALQIVKEFKPFAKVMGITVSFSSPSLPFLSSQRQTDLELSCSLPSSQAMAAYGGSPIGEQISELKKGAEIVVGTPGRMIDLLTANSGRVTNLKRVTYLVLDEADRMFDMGFEPQVRNPYRTSDRLRERGR